MFKPKITITTKLEVDFPSELEEYLWELFRPRIDALIAEKLRMLEIMVDEYMPMAYLVKKYSFSRQTFHKIKNSSNVSSFRRAKFNYYNVEQFTKAFLAYRPEKPMFKNKYGR